MVDLANCLNSMGARIEGAGTSSIVIEGVERLGGADYGAAGPHRTGTFLVAAAITGGKVTQACAPKDAGCRVGQTPEDAGAHISTGDDWIDLDMRGRQRPQAVNITTAPYPAFPPTYRPSSPRSIAWRKGLA